MHQQVALTMRHRRISSTVQSLPKTLLQGRVMKLVKKKKTIPCYVIGASYTLMRLIMRGNTVSSMY